MCSSPPNLPNSTMNEMIGNQGPYKAGDVVTYTCNLGYHLKGSMGGKEFENVCTIYGIWISDKQENCTGWYICKYMLCLSFQLLPIHFTEIEVYSDFVHYILNLTITSLHFVSLCLFKQIFTRLLNIN